VPHPDLDAEQSYVDDAYRCLAAMRERTRRASESADNAAQAVDSAIAHAHLAHRLGSLDDDVPGLSFGRLDGDGGDTWYVGRRHVEDDRGDPAWSTGEPTWRSPSTGQPRPIRSTCGAADGSS
jgi:hypothetical protein